MPSLLSKLAAVTAAWDMFPNLAHSVASRHCVLCNIVIANSLKHIHNSVSAHKFAIPINWRDSP